MGFRHEQRSIRRPRQQLSLECLEERCLLSYPAGVGTLGGDTSHAYGINALGQVVGQGDMADGPAHAFMSDGMTMSDLGTFGLGGSSIAYCLNASGQVVGSSRLPPGDGKSPVHAFVVDGTGMHDLGTLEGGRNSEARGINASGRVIGFSDNASGLLHAFFFDTLSGSAQGMRDLGTLGGQYSEAFGINDSGEVVGSAQVGPGDGKSPAHAFRYDVTGMHDLGTLYGGESSTARAINNAGEVVGDSDAPSGLLIRTHAFLSIRGTMTDLGTLGGLNSSALGINDTGDVVGWSQVAPGDGKSAIHAFVYSGGQMFDLNDLLFPDSGWTLEQATGMSGGNIVGLGRSPAGADSAFIWNYWTLEQATGISRGQVVGLGRSPAGAVDAGFVEVLASGTTRHSLSVGGASTALADAQSNGLGVKEVRQLALGTISFNESRSASSPESATLAAGQRVFAEQTIREGFNITLGSLNASVCDSLDLLCKTT